MGVLRRFGPAWYTTRMLINAFKLVVLERYAQFEGRAGRAEYWWFFLANLLISVGFSILGRAAGFILFIGWLVSLALLIPSLAVAIRRLHDTSRSGWWLLIALIPFVGWIILIVFLASEGTPGSNEYGVTAAGP
jgi:uncharacterized membrane protein YhaH (DUF805 family)